MILMRAVPFRGQLEGVGRENRDFLGPEMAYARCHFRAQKHLSAKIPPLRPPTLQVIIDPYY